MILSYIKEAGSEGVPLDEIARKMILSSPAVLLSARFLIDKGIIVRKNNRFFLKEELPAA
ncbi:hypothetical protein D3C71_2096100 [compost metagenome]